MYNTIIGKWIRREVKKNMNNKYIKLWISFMSILIFAAILLLVVNNMQHGEIPRMDSFFRECMIGLRNEHLTPIVIGITNLGDAKMITYLCIFLVLWSKTRFTIGLPIAASSLITVSIQTFFKH